MDFSSTFAPVLTIRPGLNCRKTEKPSQDTSRCFTAPSDAYSPARIVQVSFCCSKSRRESSGRELGDECLSKTVKIWSDVNRILESFTMCERRTPGRLLRRTSESSQSAHNRCSDQLSR